MNIFKNMQPKPNIFIPCSVGDRSGIFQGYIIGYEPITTPSGMPMTIKHYLGVVQFSDGTIETFTPASIKFGKDNKNG